MTDHISRRLDMLHVTLEHFDKHPEAWAGIEPIEETVDEVRAGAATIVTAGEVQAKSGAKGLTRGKTSARDEATALLVRLGLKVSPYARKANDPGLAEAVVRSRTEWDNLSEANYLSNAAEALDGIEAALPRLAAYRVEKKDVTEARAAVERLRPLKATRDEAQNHQEVAGDTMEATYTGLVPVLKSLDELVDSLVEDAEFVAAYHKAREIVGD